MGREDLFADTFTESYLYPSFNTRDLDTVDDGGLQHIPDMLSRIQKRHDSSTSKTTTTDDDDALVVMVVHFLGVDHIGHMYSPHNKHMDVKLKQMDVAWTDVLEIADNHKDTCYDALRRHLCH